MNERMLVPRIKKNLGACPKRTGVPSALGDSETMRPRIL